MILQSLDLLRSDPLSFILVIAIGLAGLIIGFTVHEFSHALTAHGEGDSTARRMGRLTLNPVKHVDWLGFALMIVAGFGWAKPVQVTITTCAMAGWEWLGSLWPGHYPTSSWPCC